LKKKNERDSNEDLSSDEVSGSNYSPPSNYQEQVSSDRITRGSVQNPQKQTLEANTDSATEENDDLSGPSRRRKKDIAHAQKASVEISSRVEARDNNVPALGKKRGRPPNSSKSTVGGKKRGRPPKKNSDFSAEEQDFMAAPLADQIESVMKTHLWQIRRSQISGDSSDSNMLMQLLLLHSMYQQQQHIFNQQLQQQHYFNPPQQQQEVMLFSQPQYLDVLLGEQITYFINLEHIMHIFIHIIPSF
jgi:hypothetical protein